VTLSLALGHRFPWRRVPVYIVSQFVGAVGAALLVWWFYGPRARTIAHLVAPRRALGVGAGRVFVVETIGTFVLVLVIVAVAQEREQSPAIAFVAAGAALASAFLISGPVGGVGVNPAGVFAPMLVSGIFTDWWVYVLAPLVGGAGAVLLYGVLTPASVR
jgi:glycerol uptake facilitator-like aquaporin